MDLESKLPRNRAKAKDHADTEPFPFSHETQTQEE